MSSHLTEIFIDLDSLCNADQQAWLWLLEFVARGMGLQLTIKPFAGLPPDDGGEYAYITDSAALTRKLLLNVPRIFVQPQASPARVDAFFRWWLKEELNEYNAACPTVTLISSVFCGDEFIGGFLSNMASLIGYADCQHLLIRAASPGNEHRDLVDHVRSNPHSVYINLSRDPGLYAVWNLGIQLATGRYLSNANIDDRRAPSQLAYLQSVLEKHPEVAVASTPLRVSLQKNLTWAASEACTVWFAEAGEQIYGPELLFRQTPHGLASRNLPHCMPLWRRSLHAIAGDFDEKRYGPSADWAFWLKASRRGACLHIGGPPLGLYLRDEATYWRRNPATRNIDARIVAEFDHPLAAADWLGWRAPSVEFLAAVEVLRNGAVLDGIGRLLLATARIVEAPVSERCTASKLIDLVCRRFLGCDSGLKWVNRYAYWVGKKPIPDYALFNALADLVHGFDPLKLGQDASSVERSLALACIDWEECYADRQGLALLAMLARRSGKPERERQLLQGLFCTEKIGFWSVVQNAYRFDQPLEALCEVVGSEVSNWVPAKPMNSYRVLFYPAYNNDYQNLLYAPLLAAGGRAIGFRSLHEFLDCNPNGAAGDILHVHWENEIFGNPGLSRDQLTRLSARLLSWLTQQKAAGCKIFWTIHNHLSHECTDPEAEIAFRSSLYRLADEVYVHHPLIASLVDWLPDHCKLRLCEHGAYDISAAHVVTRQEARRHLGLLEEAWVVAWVGQVRDYKGLGLVLPVLFEQLAAQPRMHLLIAGQVRSPEVRNWLEAHLHPRLTVLNEFLSDDDLIRVMRAADVGLLSYKSIMTSGSLFHWLTCGRPIIAPAIGTIPAYVVPGWNGWLYDDHDDLRLCLAAAAQLPVEETKRLEANALETASKLKWRMWES